MPKYRVVAGKHHQRQPDGSEKTYNQGDTLEMSASEAASYLNKFVPVVEDVPEPKEEAVAEAPKAPAKPAPAAPKAAPK
jgi:hypothetical protein